MKKNVFRINKTEGGFTTISKKLLYDTNISALAFRVMTSILNDSDNFDLSYQLMMSRFKKSECTIREVFNELEYNGYIQRYKVQRGFDYIISEFGNLTPIIKSKKEVPNKSKNTGKFISNNSKEEIVPTVKIEIISEEKTNSELVCEYIDTLIKYKFETPEKTDEFLTNIGDLDTSDFIKFKNNVESIMNEYRISLVKKCLSDNRTNTNLTADKKYRSWLNNEMNNGNFNLRALSNGWYDFAIKRQSINTLD